MYSIIVARTSAVPGTSATRRVPSGRGPGTSACAPRASPTRVWTSAPASRRAPLDHDDRLVLLLVVAQRDLPLDLVEIGGDLPPLLLRALADQVEGVAHLDLHALVLGRVVDPVLADELLAAGRVGLVHAHLALGQRHAEPVVLRVL